MARRDVPRSRVEFQVRTDLLRHLDDWAERLVVSRNQLLEMLIAGKFHELSGQVIGIEMPDQLPGLPDVVEQAGKSQEAARREFEAAGT